MWRIASAVLIAALSTSALAARSCKPSENFEVFLSHFERDPSFQESRIASPVRVFKLTASGAGTEVLGPEKFSVRSFLAGYGGFPNPSMRTMRGLETETVTTTAVTASVRVFSPNSRAYDRTYRFSRVRGCWRMESLTSSAP